MLCGIGLWKSVSVVGLMFAALLPVYIYQRAFFFCLDTKETKNQASIFLHQKSSNGFPYRDPSRSCCALNSGVTPCGQRSNPYRDFLDKNIRAVQKTFL
jgi:hypothetical protein